MNYQTINIIGAGCIGHLLTLRLSKFDSVSDLDVNLYARKTINTLELQYKSPEETFSRVFHYSILSRWKQPDLIILCVKSPQLGSLCQQLSNLKLDNKIDASIPILIMMNGMGLIELISSYFPLNPIFQAVTTHGVKFERNRLVHTGYGETHLGGLQDKKYWKHINALSSLLNRYLPKTFKSTNIEKTLWRKLLINAIINPLTAIHNIENGQITSNPEIKLESSLLCQELTPLLNYLNIFEDNKQLFEQVCIISYQTKNNISSMRQDHINRRKSEIESITGYLLAKAKSLNINLPLHNKIYRKIKRLENHF